MENRRILFEGKLRKLIVRPKMTHRKIIFKPAFCEEYNKPKGPKITGSKIAKKISFFLIF